MLLMQVYWRVSWQYHAHSNADDDSEISLPSHHGEREKTKSFNPSWADTLTLKFLLMAAELKPFTPVIVILRIGWQICLLIFPSSRANRGQRRCSRSCYAERDGGQLRSLYAYLIQSSKSLHKYGHFT